MKKALLVIIITLAITAGALAQDTPVNLSSSGSTDPSIEGKTVNVENLQIQLLMQRAETLRQEFNYIQERSKTLQLEYKQVQDQLKAMQPTSASKPAEQPKK